MVGGGEKRCVMREGVGKKLRLKIKFLLKQFEMMLI